MANNAAVQERIVERIAEEAVQDKDAATKAKELSTNVVMARDELHRENLRLQERLRLQEDETKVLQVQLDKTADELVSATGEAEVLRKQWHAAMKAMNRRDEAMQVCTTTIAAAARGPLP